MRRFLDRVVIVLVVVIALGAIYALWLDPLRGGEATAVPSATAPRPSGSVNPGPSRSPSGGPSPTPGIPKRPADAFAMTMRYAYDGDTISATVVTPNAVVTTTNAIRIRVIGIDTPEGAPTMQCWADQARTNLRALVPVGSTIWVAPDKDTWDPYQRRLFNVWTTDGTFIPYAMVASGDAQVLRIWPNVTYDKLLQAAQVTAQKAKLGQWGHC